MEKEIVIIGGLVLAYFLLKNNNKNNGGGGIFRAPTFAQWQATNAKLGNETDMNYCLRYAQFINTYYPGTPTNCTEFLN